MPGRVPDQFDVGFFDFLESEEFALNIRGDLAAHVAAGSGERHLHIDDAVVEGDVIDEPEVHDVEGNLGIVTGAELVPDGLFGKSSWGAGGSGLGLVEVHSRMVRDGGAKCNGFAASRLYPL
jgi:hypothetical protein